MAMTQFLAQKVLNASLRGQPFASTTRVDVALFTASPGFLGDASSEVVDSGYSRADAAQGGVVASGWSAPDADGTSANAKQLLFGQIADAEVTVRAAALMDQDGNMLDYGLLPQSVTLPTGGSISFNPGTVIADLGAQ